MLYHFFIRQMNRMNSSSDFVTMMVPLTSSTYYYYYYYVYYYYYYYSTVTVFKLHGSGRLVVVTPRLPNLHLASSELWCWFGERGILTKLSLCYSLVLWIGLDLIGHYTYFTLPCRGLGVVGLALYLVDWPTVVLQCLTLLVGSSDP